MSETVQHVEQMVDATARTDVTETFEEWQRLLAALKTRIDERFELHRDPSTADLESYGDPEQGASGRLAAYSGPEIDWLVHSWIGDPRTGFVNMHLTAWLGPHIRVPHLGCALLLWPQGWFYVDAIARADLIGEADYYDRYYLDADEPWLSFKADHPDFTWFTSRTGFIRASLSPTAYCYSFPPTRPNLDTVAEILTARVDQWLGWVDAAEPVPAAERPALAARDLAIRRNIAERDPANVMGRRMFGDELTDRLVRGLWGGDRVLERPAS
ncbi:oxidoreductase [Nocardia sp. CDC159]|uniref:Oxidoreductase n=1 Tax=Nocardia pulmonis TaxID=2951408 RepID=A0A9X2IUZ8_9NOCA|nr:MULTISPECIES: oxidoreductase [Nocardia]MCM6771924.1 oxidoreductase [Nocardia pulmonis]MCM6785418.1 oxidoreductase [Nocardia sp. CDC159]